MIWLDITDPKYVLFFKDFIPLLKTLDEVLITTRASKGYDECSKLLQLFKIPAICVGGYGGGEKLDKLQARLDRQKEFLVLFEKYGIPKLFITGVSVEGTHTAFGLGIPIVQFSDTPLIGECFEISKLSLVAKLTLPLSNLIFRPFIVPEICYSALGVESKNIIPYQFIDVALWLKDLKKGQNFLQNYHLDSTKPTILLREEEYNAHYVEKKLPIIYESIELLSTLDVNLILMPRYDLESLKKQFSHIKNLTILDKKFSPQDFYPFIDMLIGGGGTMNLEACYLGIPTISTRSLFLFHDRYLLDHQLMQHCITSLQVFNQVKSWLEKKPPNTKLLAKKLFEPSIANFESIFAIIKQRFYIQN